MDLFSPEIYFKSREAGLNDQQIAEQMANKVGIPLKNFVDAGLDYGQIARQFSQIDETDYQKQINPQQEQPEVSGDFISGIKRGIDQTQAMGYGAAALVGSAVGSDTVKDWGMEGYNRNIEEAGQNPKKNTFKDVYTGEAGIGGTIDWMQGTLGELVPSMAEAAVGAAVGSFVAPGPGTGVGAFAGRTILKKSIDKLTKKAVEAQIKKGIIKEGTELAAESVIRKQVTTQALKKLGGKIGMGAAVLPMESGGNYAGLLEEKGIDAPGTALFFGALSTSFEYAGGNSRLIDTIIDGVSKGKGGIVKRAAKELLTNIPEEALQEGGQEVFSILNTIVNTDEKFLTSENIEQIIESAGAGAVGGGAGAFSQTVLKKSSPADALSSDPDISSAADQQNKEDIEKVLAGEDISDEYELPTTENILSDQATPDEQPNEILSALTEIADDLGLTGFKRNAFFKENLDVIGGTKEGLDDFLNVNRGGTSQEEQNAIEQEILAQRNRVIPQEEINQARINQTLSDEELADRETNQYLAGKSDFLQKLDMMQQEVNSTQTGGVTQEIPTQQIEGKAIVYSANSPRWMQELQSQRKADGKKALSRVQINALIENTRNNKPLTDIQQDQFNYLSKTINEYTGETGEFVAQDEANDLERRGFDLLGSQKIPAGDLNIGDKIVATIDGVKDEFDVGAEVDGEITLKDGVTKKVDVFDEVDVEAIKKGEIDKPISDFANNILEKEEINDIIKEPKAAFNQQGIETNGKEKQLDLFEYQAESLPKVKLPGVLRSKQQVRTSRTGRVDNSKEGFIIQNPQDAATYLSHLVVEPQENVYFISLDKNGKVLETVRHSVGIRGSSLIDTVAAVVPSFRLKNIDTIVFAHNHPSGVTNPSEADKTIIKKINDVASLKDIKVVPLIVGNKEFATFDKIGNTSEVTPIKDTIKKIDIPLSKRLFTKRVESTDKQFLSQPDALKRLAKEEDGFLLLNSQNQEVGFLPFPSGMTEKEITRMVLQAAEETNASTMVVNNKPSKNKTKRKNFLGRLSDALLDNNLIMFDIFSYDGNIASNTPQNIRRDPIYTIGDLNNDNVVFSTTDSLVNQTETPEFKKWFGDSKVVDENGDPLVVYHGTDQEFTEFDLAKLGSFTNANSAKLGFFFSPKPNIAAMYGLGGEATNGIDSAYDVFQVYESINGEQKLKLRKAWANINNGKGSTTDWGYRDSDRDFPLLLSMSSDLNIKNLSPEEIMRGIEVWQFFKDNGLNVPPVPNIYKENANLKPVYLSIKNPVHIKWTNFSKDHVDATKKGLRLGDYMLSKMEDNTDGFFIEMSDGHTFPVMQYVAVNPTQIKSAIGNNGQFDPNNPDIRFQTDQTPGQGVNLKDIQKRFTGQEVFISPDNSISIKLKNGKGLKIVNTKAMSNGDVQYAIQSGAMGKNGTILGKFESGTITLNKDLANNFTLDHETYHFLKAAGIITKADQIALRNKLKGKLNFKLSKLKDKYAAQEENEANMFAQLLKNRESFRGTAVGRMIQKVMDFLNGVAYIGRQSATKLARDVESGNIFSRKINGKTLKTTIPQYEKAADIWYSKMEEALEQKLNNAPAVMMKNQIKSFAEKGMYKQEELDWSGVIPWLESKTGKVTKQEVLDYLDQNQVVIEDVIKGEGSDFSKEESKELHNLGVMAHLGETLTPEQDKRRLELQAKKRTAELQKETKFSQYQLPGGKDYFEFVLTMPGQIEQYKINDQHFGDAGGGTAIAWTRGSTRIVDGKKVLHIEENQSLRHQDGRKKGYKTGELPDGTSMYSEKSFGVKNTTYGYDSDWGLPTKKAVEESQEFIELERENDGDRTIIEYTKWIVELPDGRKFSNESKAKAMALALKAASRSTVPDAPFKKSWPLLAMKRMVRYASENGFDSIAWTQGNEQAERYDLSKQVDSIDVAPDDKSFNRVIINTSQGTKLIMGVEQDGTIKRASAEAEDYRGKNLEDVIGKELSAKILEEQGFFTLAGKDLKVGGEGMKAFYDKILPSEIKKFFGKKAWGNPEIGEVEIETEKSEKSFSNTGIGVTVTDRLEPKKVKLHSLEITPEMKQKALREGMPMFQTSEDIQTGEREYTEAQKNFKKVGGFGQRKKETFRERFDTIKVRAGDKLRQGIVDQFHSINKVLGDKKAWMMAHLTKSDTGVLMTAINEGMPIWDESGAIDIKEDSKSLKEILAPLGNETDDFLAWIAANRAEKLMLEGRENLFTEEQIAAGKTLNRGREQLYNDVKEDFEALGAAITDIAVKTNLVNEDEAKQWEEEGFYVPFYRMLEEQENKRGPGNINGLTNQKAYKKLKGGKSQLDDLLTNTLLNWNHLISAGLRNQAGKKALESAEKMGLASVVPKELKSKDAVYIRDNGQEVWYEFDDTPDGQLVLDAVMSLSYEGLNTPAMKAMRMFKRVLTQGVTASPGFKIRNLIRDSLHAPAVASTSKNPLKNIAVGFKYKKDMKRMKAGGGSFSQEGYLHGNDPNAMKSLVGVSADTILNTPNKIKNMWRKYEEFGNTLENINRVASFRNDLAKGKSLLEANFNARDQLDFSRSGGFSSVRVLTQVIPFLNARMQGLDKIGRAVMDPDQRNQFAQVVGFYTLASVSLMLAMAGDDDYDEAPEWEKRTYHLFKIPGSDKMYRMPRPFEVGAIAYMTEQMTKQFADKNSKVEDLGSALYHTLSDTFSVSAVPQAFKPMLEIYANKDSFRGTPIESMSMQNMSKKERSRPWTSEVAKGTSSIMSKLLPEGATLSPVEIEHLVRAYTGWAGATTLASIDLIIKKINGDVIPETKLSEYTWNPVSSFAREGEAKSSEYVTKFYDNMSELNTMWADIRKYRDTDGGKKVTKKQREKLKYRKLYNKISKELSSIRKEEEKIYNDKHMTAGAKRLKLSAKRMRKNSLAKRIVIITNDVF